VADGTKELLEREKELTRRSEPRRHDEYEDAAAATAP